MHCNTAGIADDLFIHINERRAKVYEYVNDEHDIYDVIDKNQRIVVDYRSCVVAAGAGRSFRCFCEHEGSHVRRDDSRVHHEEKDQPVPNGFEGGVVKNSPWVYLGRFDFVFRQNISTQGHDLGLKIQ